MNMKTILAATMAMTGGALPSILEEKENSSPPPSLRKSYLHTGPVPSGCVVSSHTFFWGRSDLIYSVTAQVVHGKNAKAKKLQKFKKIFIELGSWIHSATHEEIIASGVFTITKDPNYVQPTGTDSTAADH